VQLLMWQKFVNLPTSNFRPDYIVSKGTHESLRIIHVWDVYYFTRRKQLDYGQHIVKDYLRQSVHNSGNNKRGEDTIYVFCSEKLNKIVEKDTIYQWEFKESLLQNKCLSFFTVIKSL